MKITRRVRCIKCARRSGRGGRGKATGGKTPKGRRSGRGGDSAYKDVDWGEKTKMGWM